MSQVVARAEAPEIAGVVDPVWAKLRQEAEAAIRQEPSLTSFILTMILNHDTLESAVTHRVAARLGHPTLSADLIGQTFCEAFQADPAIGRLMSVPDFGKPPLNDLHLRGGRWMEAGHGSEVLISEAFAEAHHLRPGDTIRAILNGRKKELTIVGTAISRLCV